MIFKILILFGLLILISVLIGIRNWLRAIHSLLAERNKDDFTTSAGIATTIELAIDRLTKEIKNKK
jgi:hypothetical protein